jgi:hypothetical protein
MTKIGEMRSNDPLARRITIRVGLLTLQLLAWGVPAHAQPVQRAVTSVDVQRLANGVLGVMSYTVAPDVTTSALAISNAAIGSPGLTMQQLGGSFTWSKTLPLYLEGNAAYSRFDPVFAATDGAGQGFVPVEWEAVSGTGGIGWDFRVSDRWVVRPIFNVMLGAVASDLGIARWWLDNNSNLDLTFLNGGRMKVYGVGGALMLEYENSAAEAEDDLQLRYTNVQLRSYDTPNLSVAGHAKAENVSLWARRRVPTPWTALQRPVRWVFEGAYTDFLGDQRELGLRHMASLGLGIELDSSAKDIWVSRWRALVRYKFGEHVHGVAVGLAVSF